MDRYDHNFARSLATFGSTSKTGEVLESRDAVLTTTRGPVAEMNQCLLKTPGYKLERTLERVEQYRRRVGVPLRMHVAEEHAAIAPALAARGYVAADPVPAMVLDPIEPAAPPVGGLDVRRVDDSATLADFGATAFETFGYPVELAPVAMTEDLTAWPGVELFVGYLDGAPACCSMLLVSGDVAGIYWVGVRAPHRRRGLGAAVTAHAALAGKARGCNAASLQASVMGAPVYARMGFSRVRNYLRFDLPAA